MILISHRGNIDGKKPHLENTPDYIDEAISLGYDVEIDVWYKENEWWLGHDDPEHPIDFDWIEKRSHKLWVHCKNVEALSYFVINDKEAADINYFWHENDTATLTSFCYIWAYPGKQPIKGSVAVMPERYDDNISECMGICSDVIKKYKEL